MRRLFRSRQQFSVYYRFITFYYSVYPQIFEVACIPKLRFIFCNIYTLFLQFFTRGGVVYVYLFSRIFNKNFDEMLLKHKQLICRKTISFGKLFIDNQLL